MALWRSIASDSASVKDVLVSCGWYMVESSCSLGLEIVWMRLPSGACIHIRSDEVGWAVSSNVPVGLASRSGLIG